MNKSRAELSGISKTPKQLLEAELERKRVEEQKKYDAIVVPENEIVKNLVRMKNNNEYECIAYQAWQDQATAEKIAAFVRDAGYKCTVRGYTCTDKPNSAHLGYNVVVRNHEKGPCDNSKCAHGMCRDIRESQPHPPKETLKMRLIRLFFPF